MDVDTLCFLAPYIFASSLSMGVSSVRGLVLFSDLRLI
jgi:hypothetical protein